jgi:hypothetical protein
MWGAFFPVCVFFLSYKGGCFLSAEGTRVKGVLKA